MNHNVLIGLRNDIEIYRCRDLIDKTPHYQRYLAQVNRLRDKYREVLLLGTYRDTDGFASDNPRVSARSFVNGNRMAIVVTQSFGDAAVTGIRVPGYSYKESGSVGEVKIDAAPGGGHNRPLRPRWTRDTDLSERVSLLRSEGGLKRRTEWILKSTVKEHVMQTRFIAMFFATLLCAATAVAGTLSLEGSTDKAPVSYLPGEPITFKVQLVEDGKPLAGKILKWLRTGDDRKTSRGQATSSATRLLEITSSIDTPGFVRLEVAAYNQDFSPLKDAKGAPLKFEGGAGAQSIKLNGYPEPADFDAFWKAQKARLAQVPLNATLKEATSPNPRFMVFDVKVDCAGGKPVSGYLSLPKGAKAKSLAAQLSVRGYGVTGADPECHEGMIVFPHQRAWHRERARARVL